VSDRNAFLNQWLTLVLGSESFDLAPASSDASFRRYWRVTCDDGTLIAMDAPPAHEDCGRFADLSRRFRSIGLNTPEIHAEDRELGFLLISDLGNRVYLDHLDADNADRLYGDAFAALAALQRSGHWDGLPLYDASFLLRELGIFRDWFLGAHLGLTLSGDEQRLLDRANDVLIVSALEQPRVCVHRDYHSRNLMLTEEGNPGVLDFQDAVVGPVTYDLVSLLRDCYISWPAQRVEDWALGYQQVVTGSGVLSGVEPRRFLRWFDLMGAQRHLKACGIFARLNHRDGKSGYLGDIPRTLGYVVDVAGRYDELAELSGFLAKRVQPLL
jgi:N-acetylmuramate 1-kinase